MANTLELGNGKWATGKDTVLAFNDENNNFKPLPFSFSRASSGTVVNKAGLIETVGSGEPRIDFKDNSKGSLLLEPTRRNVLPYSNKFLNTGWQYYRGTITANATISPDGTLNASRYQEDSQTGGHLFRRQSLSITNGLSYTGSIFVKKGEYNVVRLASNSTSRWVAAAEFSLENGTVTSGTGVIENYGNGWYRCSISGNAVETTTSAGFEIYTSVGTGIDGNGLFMYGAMFEQGSYATSYIPTSGQANGVTRVAESSSQTPPDGVIGQTEGTLYVDFKFKGLPNNVSSMPISIDGSGSNEAYIYIDVNNTIYGQFIVGGSFTCNISGDNLILGNTYKIAFAYKNSDFALFVNGVLSNSSNSGAVGANQNIVIGNYLNGNYPHDNINEAKLYNTRLSNSELAALTQ